MKLRKMTVLVALLFSMPLAALDQEACDTAAKKIDDRLAQGNHPQQNVALATQMRDGIVQSCAFIDEATLAGMFQGLDQLLPGGGGASVAEKQSPAERNAEREAQRSKVDQRRAERDERRAAAQAREAAEQGLVSDVARKPPTGRSTKGQFMSRADKMWNASIVDWDFYKDSARLLYVTQPSREQHGVEDAARHYYVVEFASNDTIVQHHIVETDLARTTTAGLVRGRDEIVLQWYEGRPGSGEPVAAFLERWSVSDATLLSRSPAPQMKGPRGALGPGHLFQLVTGRGDLLYSTSVALGTGPTPRIGVAWMLVSPEGDIRDRQLIAHDDESVSTQSWFHSADGGAGLILDLLATEETGISSALKPATQQFGGTAVRPLVGSERRLYIVGNSETGVALPAFERRLMWSGMENIDPSVMISGESTRLISAAEGEYRAQDSTVSQAVAGSNRSAVVPSGNGHAVLLKNNHRDDGFPPTRGLWLQEFAPGTARRDTYLEPDAKHLKAVFNMLASDSDGNLYVADTKSVLRLNSVRELTARAESRASNAKIQAIVAGDDMVWLFGEHSGGSTTQKQVWVERIQF